MWMSMIADGHDCICNCPSPFGHLLASIFPPGHQDRDLTIEAIINRDIQECLSGGPEERGSGEEREGPSTGKDIKIKTEEKEEDFTEEDLNQLLAAAEDATKR